MFWSRLVSLFAVMLNCSFAATYYVAVGGSDSGPGSFAQPYATITKAVSIVAAGDSIYVRGGTYTLTTAISISKKGTASAGYYLSGYENEYVLLDCSQQALGKRGIELKGNYWSIAGINIKGAGDNGMYITGSNNLVERCAFFENRDTGCQLSGGASLNRIINCDSYFNSDPSEGNADGFSPKLDVGNDNYFYGCRSWQNSDDGWDGYLRPSDDVRTVLENCWCFMNGYRKNGTASTGNGNGFKMGGSDTKLLMHNFTLKNCIAFDNRVKGFDENNNKGTMILYNCSAYRNGTNYGIPGPLATGKEVQIKNCLSLGSYGSIGSFAVQVTNSWLPPLSCSAQDFISIDTTGVRGPRRADGSLPDVQFLHLSSRSALIDAGTDIGLPYYGSAPDIGAFEFNVNGIQNETNIGRTDFILHQNYPNPFNPSTSISFSIPKTEKVTLKIFDILGREAVVLINEVKPAGSHKTSWDASGLNSGVYLLELKTESMRVVKKMILEK